MRNGLEFFTGLVATHLSFMMDVPAGTMTSGRAKATAAAVVGLISLIIGGLALLLGLIGIALSAIHLSGATGGFGTGSGRLGAIVGLVLGLIGMCLGGLALARARRAETSP